MNDSIILHRLVRRLQQRNRLVGRSVETGLSLPESHFLVELDAQPSISISELSERLRVDQSFASRLGTSLEKQGHITTVRDPSDSRKKKLIITASGRETIKRIDKTANAHYERMASHLSAHEIRQLVWLFKAVADGCKIPPASVRPTEAQYRAEQRRFTRACGLLGDSIFGLSISTSVWQILSEVVLAKSPPSVGELASLLSVAQNSLSSAATSMVNRKLVTRESSAKDKRTVLLYPTAAGKRLYTKIETHAANIFTKALIDQNEDKIHSAISIFKKFLQDSGGGIAPLAESYEVKLATDHKTRNVGRGLIARSYVRDGLEETLPETIASNKHRTWMLLREQKVVAVIDIEDTSNIITSAGWEQDVSAWTLQSFLNHIYQVNHISSLDAEFLENSCRYLYNTLG